MHSIDKTVIRSIQTQRTVHLPNREWNSAHRAGATCARELADWRLEPTQALPDDPELALYFEHGHWVEKEALQNLVDAGYVISEQDRPFEWRKMQLRGHIDCKITTDRQKHPLEVKGYAPWVWGRLNSVEDFLQSDIEYIRRVPGQTLSYCLMDNSDFGFIHLINKMNGRPKTIRLDLDGETLRWGEEMLKRLERVNRAVKRGVPPERIKYEESVCGECRFRHICLKEIRPVKGLTVFRGQRYEHLLELLKARARLKDSVANYDEVDSEISELVKGHVKVVCGDWMINGQEVKVGRQIRKPYKFWRKSIISLKDANRKAE